MTMICHTTRYTEAVAVSSPSTNNSIKHFEERIINRHSTPKRIVLDRGSAFTAKLFTDFAAKHGIELMFTPPNYHQPNGTCERLNKTITEMLSKVCKKQTDWSRHVQEVAYKLNITCHSVTKKSPFFLLYGREPRLDIDNKLKPICTDLADQN